MERAPSPERGLKQPSAPVPAPVPFLGDASSPSPSDIGPYTLLLPDESAFWDERVITMTAMDAASAIFAIFVLLFVGLQRQWSIQHPLVTEVACRADSGTRR
jgi:hypothetical protein